MTILKPAVVYERNASSKRKTNELDARVRQCKLLAKQYGYHVAHIFHDEGIGGNTLERPALHDMLDFLARQQEQIAVFTTDLRRIARDMAVYAQIRQRLKEAGAILITPNGTFDGSPDSDFLEMLKVATIQRKLLSH